MLGLSFFKSIVDSVAGYFSSRSKNTTGLMLRGSATDSSEVLVLGAAALTSVVTTLQQMSSSRSITHEKPSFRGSVLDMATATRLTRLGENQIIPTNGHVLNLDEEDSATIRQDQTSDTRENGEGSYKKDGAITTTNPVTLVDPATSLLSDEAQDADTSATLPKHIIQNGHAHARRLTTYPNIYDTYTATITTAGIAKFLFQTNANCSTAVPGGGTWVCDTPQFSQANPFSPTANLFYNATERSVTYVAPSNVVGLLSTLVTVPEWQCNTQSYLANPVISPNYCIGPYRNYVLTFNINVTDQGFGPPVYSHGGSINAPIGQLQVTNPVTAPQLNGFGVYFEDIIKNYTTINNTYTQGLLPTESLVGKKVTDVASTIIIDSGTPTTPGTGQVRFIAPSWMAALDDIWVTRTMTDILPGTSSGTPMSITVEYRMNAEDIPPVMLTHALPALQAPSGSPIYISGPTCSSVNPIFYELAPSSSPGVTWSAQTNQAVILSPVPGQDYIVNMRCTNGISPALPTTTMVSVTPRDLSVNAAYISSSQTTPIRAASLSLSQGTVTTLDGSNSDLTYSLADYYTNSAGQHFPIDNTRVTFTADGQGSWQTPPGMPADTYTFYITARNAYGVTTTLPKVVNIAAGTVSLTEVSPIFTAGVLGQPFRRDITSLISNPYGYTLQVQMLVQNSDGSSAPLSSIGFALETTASTNTTTGNTTATQYALVSSGVPKNSKHSWPLITQLTWLDSAGNVVGDSSNTATLTTQSLPPELLPGQTLTYANADVHSGSYDIAIRDPNGSPLTYALDDASGLFKVTKTTNGCRISYGSTGSVAVSPVDAVYPLTLVATNADGLSVTVPVSVSMGNPDLVVTSQPSYTFRNGIMNDGLLVINYVDLFSNPTGLAMTFDVTVDPALAKYVTISPSGVIINPKSGIQTVPHTLTVTASTASKTASVTIPILYVAQPPVAAVPSLAINYDESNGVSYVVPNVFSSLDGAESIVSVEAHNLPDGILFNGVTLTVPSGHSGMPCGAEGPYLLATDVAGNTARVDICLNSIKTQFDVKGAVTSSVSAASGLFVVGAFLKVLMGYRNNKTFKQKIEDRLQARLKQIDKSLSASIKKELLTGTQVITLKTTITDAMAQANAHIVAIVELIKRHQDLEAYVSDYGVRRKTTSISRRVESMAHAMKDVEASCLKELSGLNKQLSLLNKEVHKLKVSDHKYWEGTAFHNAMAIEALRFRKLSSTFIENRELPSSLYLLDRTLNLYSLAVECWDKSGQNEARSIYTNLNAHALLKDFLASLKTDLKATGCQDRDAKSKERFYKELLKSKPWIFHFNKHLCSLLESIYAHDVMNRSQYPLVITSDIKYELMQTLTEIIQALRPTGSIKDTVTAEEARAILLVFPDDMPQHFLRFLKGLLSYRFFDQAKYQQTVFQLGRGIPRSWVSATYMLRQLAVQVEEHQTPESFSQIEEIYYSSRKPGIWKGGLETLPWIGSRVNKSSGIDTHITYWALSVASHVLAHSRNDELSSRCLSFITKVITNEPSLHLRGFSPDAVRNDIFSESIYPALQAITFRMLPKKRCFTKGFSMARLPSSPMLLAGNSTSVAGSDVMAEHDASVVSLDDGNGSAFMGVGVGAGADEEKGSDSPPPLPGGDSPSSSSSSGDSSSVHSEESEGRMYAAYHHAVKMALSLRAKGFETLLNTYLGVDYSRLPADSKEQKRYHDMLQHVLLCADVPDVKIWLNQHMKQPHANDTLLPNPLRNQLYRLVGELLSDKRNRPKMLTSYIEECYIAGDDKAKELMGSMKKGTRLGTGGHINPAYSIIRAATKRNFSSNTLFSPASRRTLAAAPPQPPSTGASGGLVTHSVVGMRRAKSKTSVMTESGVTDQKSIRVEKTRKP